MAKKKIKRAPASASVRKSASKTKTKRAAKTGWGFEIADAIKHLRKQDPLFKKMMETVGEFTLMPSVEGSPFDALLRSIIYQQLNGKAAATIHARVQALYGDRNPTPEQLLDTQLTQLRRAGLSGNKSKALYDLAQKTLDGVVPTLAQLKKLSDEQIIERLSSVRGIGKWTVEMLLIFRLGRADILPIDDFALKKSVAQLYGLKAAPSRKEFEAIGEKWRPYRTVASWYLWRALDR